MELQKATNNKALFQLMEIQKTLVYFSTALKDNDIVLQKVMRMTKSTTVNYLKTTEEDIDLLEDVIIDTNGNIQRLVLEEKRGRKFSKEEYEILWSQIVKIGDDIILIDTRNK